MSTEPRDLTLERVNRLSYAVADLMDSHAALGKNLIRILDSINEQLSRLDARIDAQTKEIRNLASEQALLGNRVENAFARAFRVEMRVDELTARIDEISPAK
jgi:chromosome segregation ATPase